MIKRKWYRWLQCLLGSRSFVKTNEKGDETHIIVNRAGYDALTKEDDFFKDYVEEWPRG